MRADLDETSFVDADDAVAIAHRGEPVRDDDTVRPFAMLRHIGLDDARSRSPRAGRLVEKSRIAGGWRARGRIGDALALAAGKVGAALLDRWCRSQAASLDELVGAGKTAAAMPHATRQGGIGERDVLVDGAVEQRCFPAARRRSDGAARRYRSAEVSMPSSQDLPTSGRGRAAG